MNSDPNTWTDKEYYEAHKHLYEEPEKMVLPSEMLEMLSKGVDPVVCLFGCKSDGRRNYYNNTK